MDTFNIGDRTVGPGEPTFIIAEAGSNHNGDLETAKELIDVAVDAGADAVKFQTFRAENLYVEDSGADENLDSDDSIFDTIRSLEHPSEWIPKLKSYCDKQDIIFLSTPFDEDAANALADYVPVYKVASSTVTHTPLLKHIASKNKPVIMSTGTHTLKEVQQAVNTLKNNGVTDIALLHCVAAYPTPLEQIHVQTMDTLRETFSVPVGLSDHTTDPIIAPTTAVARGGVIIEKHFTLDRSMDGPDHSFAIEPDELDRMVTAIHRTETALGNPSPNVSKIEQHSYEIARRSIHATQTIQQGEEITEDNTAVLRPGKNKKGIAPSKYETILGAVASQRISKDDGITWDDINIDS